MFILRKKGRLTYLQLAWQGTIAIFTTREGGFSQKSYGELNLGLHVGDDEKRVLANRRLLEPIVGKPLSQFTFCQQVHGSEIALVDDKNAGCGGQSLEAAIPNCDGLLTAEAIPLLTLYADCVPLWIYDPQKRAGGVIHAGWRGTVAGIALEAVEQMKHHFGSQPGNLLAALGPSIGPCCYSVGEDVVGAARVLAQQIKLSVASFATAQNSGTYAFDLAGFNKALLLQAGLLEKNIVTCGFCTSCQDSLFFSHRRSGGKTGRMAAIFMLQEG